MQESLETLLADHEQNHSTLQCRSFITAKTGVTVYGQYRQALRELVSRTWAAFEEMLSREELLCTADELDEKLGELDARFDDVGSGADARRRRLTIKRARVAVQLAQLESGLDDRFREWGEFYGQSCALRDQLGLKEGETLAREVREKLEVQMFAHQFASQIRGRIMANERPLDANMTQILGTMPSDVAQPLLGSASNPDGFMDWYEREMLKLPAPPTPEQIPGRGASERLILSRFRLLEIEGVDLKGVLTEKAPA